MAALMRAYVALLRFGFYLLYQPLAGLYDLVANVVSLGHWWEWQQQTLPFLPPNGRVLEVGHGTGHLLSQLQQRGYAVVGVDLSPNMGRIARQRLRKQGLEIPLMRASAGALPLTGASLDAIVATFPTEYIIQPATLQAFKRVLRPGGRVVFLPAAVLMGGGLIKPFIRWLFYITGQSDSPSGAPTRLPGWTAYAKETYSAAGFHLMVHPIDLPDSRVWVVVAENQVLDSSPHPMRE